MLLHLEGACPLPMRDQSFSPESLWRNTLVVNGSQRTLLVAPSGTGKTSLLSFLFGMRRDYEGSIRLDHQEARDLSLLQWAKLRRERLAIVLQDMRLIPSLTVEENLLLKNNLTRLYTVAQVKAMLERLGMDTRWQQTCGTLSYGQQQRVAIVRALLQPFSLLLLDEPFSHLDEANIRLASALIEETCAKQGAGLMLVSLGDPYFFSYDQHLQL